MNNANQPQYEKLEKLLTKARLTEPSPELKERVAAEATRIWKQPSKSHRGRFRRKVCYALPGVFAPGQGPLCWLPGLPFAPVAAACPVVSR